MISANAKNVIMHIQRALGLNPKTVPKDEFLAELLAVKCFVEDSKYDCIHISFDSDEPFKSSDCVDDVPCISITLSADDTIDGLGGNILCLTYYDGDNICAGPHHALVITDPIKETLIYWRKRGQDPASEWIYNVFAKAQVSFKFNVNGNDPRFMTREALFESMQEYEVGPHIGHKIAEFLKIDASTDLLAEVACLNYWNAVNNDAPMNEGIDFSSAFGHTDGLIAITISCAGCNNINLVYEPNDTASGYNLIIIEDDNIVYKRKSDQKETTEWIINGMANDPIITDEFKNPLFIGEPVQE